MSRNRDIENVGSFSSASEPHENNAIADFAAQHWTAHYSMAQSVSAQYVQDGLRHGNLAEVEFGLSGFQSNPEALKDYMPALQKDAEAKGLTLDFKMADFAGDYSGKHAYGELTVSDGNRAVKVDTNSRLDPSVWSVDANDPQRMRSMEGANANGVFADIAGDPKFMLGRAAATAADGSSATPDAGKFQLHDTSFLSGDEKAMNKYVQADFNQVATNGTIENKQQILDYLSSAGDSMSPDEKKGWEYLAKHFGSVQGASVSLLDHIFDRSKIHHGVTQGDIKSYLQGEQQGYLTLIQQQQTMALME